MVRENVCSSPVDDFLGEQDSWESPDTSLMKNIAVTTSMNFLFDADTDACSTSSGANTDNFANFFEEADPAEEILVDIDPSEGRRRGDQLMSMLFDNKDEKPILPPARVPGPRHRLLASAAPFQPSRTPSPYTTPPNELEDPPPQQGRFSLFGGPSITHFLPFIMEAARMVFGADLEEVDHTGDSFQVRVGGEWRQKDPWEILDALSKVLWPLLGQNVVSIKPNTIPRRTWLSLKCMDTSNVPADQCWDLVCKGYCHRGSACRWAHVQPTIQQFDIEVMH